MERIFRLAAVMLLALAGAAQGATKDTVTLAFQGEPWWTTPTSRPTCPI